MIEIAVMCFLLFLQYGAIAAILVIANRMTEGKIRRFVEHFVMSIYLSEGQGLVKAFALVWVFVFSMTMLMGHAAMITEHVGFTLQREFWNAVLGGLFATLLLIFGSAVVYLIFKISESSFAEKLTDIKNRVVGHVVADGCLFIAVFAIAASMAVSVFVAAFITVVLKVIVG